MKESFATADPFEQFGRDGYLSHVRVHSQTDLAAARAEFDATCTRYDRLALQKNYLLHDRHIWVDEIWSLVTAPALLDLLECLIGGHIVLLGSRFLCKWPRDSTWVPWHQDSAKAGLSPNRQVVVWYAVDEARIDNGCLRVIPSSHLHGSLPHSPSGRREEWLVPRELADFSRAPTDGVGLELELGECAVFDSHLIHGSMPNSSNDRRCGLILRYAPASSKPLCPGQWAALVVRGSDANGNFHNLTREDAKDFTYRPAPE
jgi:ectoine hydroxylase-related dioxygenase (phytanoyl-CoA dioxygenase family)